MPVRLLIADDHRVVRTGLRLLLERQPDVEVVGEASAGAEALAMARELRPDLVILDLSMPGGSGLEVIAALATETRVLVLTMHDDPAYVRQVLRAGGHGYVLKEAADAELLAAMATVAAGRRYVYPTLAAPLLEPTPPVAVPRLSLSPRELEVLRLFALGHTFQEIAAQLAVGVRTVETYKTRLCEKLGMHTRAELVRYAIEQRLIQP